MLTSQIIRLLKNVKVAIMDTSLGDFGMPANWPEDWRDRIAAIEAEWPETKLRPRQSLSGGKSGSPLWLVDVHSPQYDGVGILKLNPDNLSDEINRHEAALADGGAFSSTYFPRIVRKSDVHGAFLMTWPGKACYSQSS
jgi:hypothetical protein